MQGRSHGCRKQWQVRWLGQCAPEGDCNDVDAQLNTYDLDGDGMTPCDGDCDDSDASVYLNTDVDGDELSIASYSAPGNGTIEKVGDFLFEYQPNAGFVGSDSFLYVLSDGEAFDVAKVLIDVVDSSFQS